LSKRKFRSKTQATTQPATDVSGVVQMPDKEKLKLLEKTPLFCIYSKHSGVWRVIMPNEVVIIHDAKHYPEARDLEDFYKERGFNVYRLDTDIMEDERIARELLARCPRTFKYK
jgi:hypothetical protein